MNVLLITLNYAPELTGIGVYNTDFAEYLTGEGHQLTVFCTFPYYPRWKKDPKYRFKFFQTERIAQVKVQRCYTFVPSTPSSVKRILHEGIFAFFAFWRILLGARPDVTVAISPPFLGIVATASATRLRRIPLHIHIQDLQPDAAIDLGMLQGRVLIRVLHALERFAYNSASLVSCIGESMLARVKAKGVPEEKLMLFRNWVNIEWESVPSSSGEGFRTMHGLGSKFLVLHAGNMGEKQSLDILLDAAAIAQQKGDDMHFLLVGDGGRRKELEAMAEEARLKNVLFLGVQPEHEFKNILRTADLSVLLQRSSVKDIVVPSKMLNILASGSPIIASVHHESETARILEELTINVIVPPEDAAALYARICEFRKNPELRSTLRNEERRLATLLFKKSSVLAPVVHRLESLKSTVV